MRAANALKKGAQMKSLSTVSPLLHGLVQEQALLLVVKAPLPYSQDSTAQHSTANERQIDIANFLEA